MSGGMDAGTDSAVAQGQTRPPLLLGAFRLIRPLVDTARGTVWAALHGSQLPVAIEVLTAPGLRSPEGRAVFRSELRWAARLDHRGIVTVLDFGEISPELDQVSRGQLPEGAPYVVTEHLPGGPLALCTEGWSWPALRALVVALLDALAHAHARRRLHRRLSPSELLLCGPGDLLGGVRLSGFGWAALFREGAEFLAPEQLPSDDSLVAPWPAPAPRVGPWTDLYALGCTAWWAATGQSPFSHAADDPDDLAQAHHTLQPPHFAPRYLVPVGLEGWLRVLLHKDPDGRFASAADARAAFAPLESAPWTESPETASPLPAPSGTRRPVGTEVRPAGIARIPLDWRRPLPRVRPRLRAAGLALLTVREMPLFGRERQRDLLWKGLRGVNEDGKPRAVVIRGPSGVGKTRLVEWIARRAGELGGVRTLWVRGDDLSGALVAYFGMAQMDPAELSRQIVDRLGRGRSAANLAQILVAGLVPGDEDTGPEPEGWRAALRRLLELESVQRPVLLVIDDAHEADEALELAREIATPSERVRRAVLVALIAREDDGLAAGPEVENRIAGVLQVSRAKIVHLEPMEPAARQELYEWLGLSEALATRVDDRSKGNPQFAIQLVEDWVTRGLLSPAPDGFHLPLGEAPSMPRDLQAVWSGRILQIVNTLPGIAAIHLERAAALGIDVDESEWSVACDDPAHGRVSDAGVQLRSQLVARLRDARLVHEVPRGFRFAHPMLLECIEQLSRNAGRWNAHHQAIATLLEAQERPDPFRVGVHWLDAGEPNKAIDPLFAGIERGMRRSGIAQVAAALVPLERALREAGVAEDDLRWARLFCRQATVLRRRGLLIAAGDLAERGQALADRPGADTVWSECTRELGRILHERGDVPAALEMLQATAARLLRANARGTELTIVLTRMSVLARMMNKLEDAERWATQAHGIIARAEIDDPTLEGSVLGELAVIASRQGKLDRAFELFDQALPLLRSAVATARLAEVENNRGDALKGIGRWDEAEAAFLEAIRLQELLGSAPEIPKLNLAMCRLHASRYAEARAVADEVVRGAATKINGTLGILARAVCDSAAGDFAAAGRDLPAVLDVLRRARLVDPDAAWLAEHGASLAVAGEATQEARLFATFAREQYEALGDGEAVSRVDAL